MLASMFLISVDHLVAVFTCWLLGVGTVAGLFMIRRRQADEEPRA